MRCVVDVNYAVEIHVGGAALPFGQVGVFRQKSLNSGNVADVHLAVLVYIAECKVYRLFRRYLRFNKPFAAEFSAHAVGRALLGVGGRNGGHYLILVRQGRNDLLRHYHLAAS